jgi:threonine dehydrogenase-like Zn-dependent dehydrogenase
LIRVTADHAAFAGLRRPKRPTLGNEFAGVVVETGTT